MVTAADAEQTTDYRIQMHAIIEYEKPFPQQFIIVY
jgi:hypothetical protein